MRRSISRRIQNPIKSYLTSWEQNPTNEGQKEQTSRLEADSRMHRWGMITELINPPRSRVLQDSTMEDENGSDLLEPVEEETTKAYLFSLK